MGEPSEHVSLLLLAMSQTGQSLRPCWLLKSQSGISHLPTDSSNVALTSVPLGRGPTHRVALRAIVPWWALGARRSGRAGGPRLPFLSSFSFGALHRRKSRYLQALNQAVPRFQVFPSISQALL